MPFAMNSRPFSTILCNHCGSNGPFYVSYLARSMYVCTSCASKKVVACRRSKPHSLLAHRFYNALRNQGIKCPTLTCSKTVKRILERCNHRSVISGECDVNRLCIHPFYRNRQPEEWHCVVVTQTEARSLSHLRSEQAVMFRFPRPLRRKMEIKRQYYDDTLILLSESDSD